MKNRNLQNENLDRIGRRLLDSTRISEAEIERVVISPNLFSRVKARINSEQVAQESKNNFGNRLIFQILSWQKISAAILLLSAVGAIGFLMFNKFNRLPAPEQSAAPKTQSVIKQNAVSTPSENLLSANVPAVIRTANTISDSPKIAGRGFFKKKTVKIIQPAPRKVLSPKIQPRQNPPTAEFYALTFAGNPGEKGEELQIVRAELSRASLFALGVNLPIENESEKIKTDLLVGADGIARAIRIVN